MRTTTKPCFSNGTEHMQWVERNCDRCWKQSKLNEKTGQYTRYYCKINEEIDLQMMGEMAVNTKTYVIAQMRDCPNRQEKRNRTPLKLRETPLFP